MNNYTRCPDLLYTIPGSNETCTGTWEELHGDALLVIRVIFLACWILLLVLYTRPLILLVMMKDQKLRSKQKFKRAAVILSYIGFLLNALFYATGNAFWPTDTVAGCLSIIGVQYGSVFLFGACGSVMLMIQQVFLSSCNGSIKSQAVTDFKPLYYFLVPYSVSIAVVNILLWAGVIGSGIMATRISLGCAVIPSAIYGAEVVYYIRPVIRAMEDSLSKAGGSSAASATMQKRVDFLRQQKVFTIVSCSVCVILFLSISVPEFVHGSNGLFMLVTQTYNETIMAGSGAVIYQLIKDVGAKTAPVSTAESATSSTTATVAASSIAPANQP